MKKKFTIFALIIIFAFFGYLVYKQFTTSKICWPYCPGMTDEDREEIKKEASGAENKIANSPVTPKEGPIEVGQRLFTTYYGSKIVSVVMENDTTDSYEGMCNGFLNEIKNNYEKRLEYYKERSIAVTPFNDLIKDFKCSDSTKGYNISFSAFYPSGDYKTINLSDKSPVLKF